MKDSTAIRRGPRALLRARRTDGAPDGDQERELEPRPSARVRGLALSPLRNVVTIMHKELYTYFASPVAYLVIFGFLIANGFLYSVILVGNRTADMTSIFGDMAIIMLFVGPAMTMRLLAEEQKTGTIELLLTSPLRETELVVGKWLSAVVFYLVMLILTAPYPIFMLKFGTPDPGPIWAGYVGIFLVGCVFLAVGLFMSSLTQNQIVSFVLSVGILLVLWLLQAGGQNFAQGGRSALLDYLALSSHFQGFTSGGIQLKDLVYFVSVIVVALFVTVRSVETRRWR